MQSGTPRIRIFGERKQLPIHPDDLYSAKKRILMLELCSTRKGKAMKKALLMAVCAIVLALGMTACGGLPANPLAKENLFDGSAYSNTGDGVFMLVGSSIGNTADGNVIRIEAAPNLEQVMISVEYSGGDGSLGTVYVDGVEHMKMNAYAESTQDELHFGGDEMAPGIHTVEFVVMDGDTPTVYKRAQYEIVGWVDVLKGYLES